MAENTAGAVYNQAAVQAAVAQAKQESAQAEQTESEIKAERKAEIKAEIEAGEWLDKEAIKKIIPHREPLLLVDEAQVRVYHNREQGDIKTSLGRYTVKGDEWFLKGHFPGNPVVPGVVLCEMMAQACSVLLGELPDLRGEGDKTPYFTGLNNVKFRNKVLAGDTLETECKITKIKKPFCFAVGKGKVNGKLAVSAEFSFAMV